jgi:serine/threonine-protein kinase
MATVHLARASGGLDGGDFERIVAVKILHPHLAADRGFVDMFLHEAHVAARIKHRNVVTILDLGVDDGLLYNVMDYVEGDSLAAVQAAAAALGRGVPLGVVLRAGVDVLVGLHVAHELRDAQGEALHVVHRDVTPQNILLGVDGVTRLTDFGIARARGRLVHTTQGMLKGKLSYMPPEQLESQEIDRRADVFAMGVTLWETLALRRLYPGRTTFEAARRGARAPYRPLRDLVRLPSSVVDVLDEVLARALAPDVDDRYATAAEFADVIEHRLGRQLATAADVGQFMAVVAGDKLARERLALRSRARPAHEPTHAGRAARAIEGVLRSLRVTTPRASPAARRDAFTAAAEASVLEPFPLVPRRRRRSAMRAPTMPAQGFFPAPPRPLEATEEPIATDDDLVETGVSMPPEFEVIDDEGDLSAATTTISERPQWAPFLAPPGDDDAPRPLRAALALALALLAGAAVLYAVLR